MSTTHGVAATETPGGEGVAIESFISPRAYFFNADMSSSLGMWTSKQHSKCCIFVVTLIFAILHFYLVDRWGGTNPETLPLFLLSSSAYFFLLYFTTLGLTAILLIQYHGVYGCKPCMVTTETLANISNNSTRIWSMIHIDNYAVRTLPCQFSLRLRESSLIPTMFPLVHRLCVSATVGHNIPQQPSFQERCHDGVDDFNPVSQDGDRTTQVSVDLDQRLSCLECPLSLLVSDRAVSKTTSLSDQPASTDRPPRHVNRRVSSKARRQKRLRTRCNQYTRVALCGAIRPKVYDSVKFRIHTTHMSVARPKGYLLGGAPTVDPTDIRVGQKISQTSRSVHLPKDIPQLDYEEDWYPLYVHRAKLLEEESTDRPFLRDVLDRDTFHDLPTSKWRQEMEALGVSFTSDTPPIEQLLPKLPSVCGLYPKDGLPIIDVPHLCLEEVLSHIRIVTNRLQRFQGKKKRILSKMSALYGKKCQLDASTRLQRRDSLWMDLQRKREAIRSHTELLTKLRRKTTSRIRESVRSMPRQVFVAHDAPPIRVSNRFSILAEDQLQLPTKTWTDFICTTVLTPPPELQDTCLKTYDFVQPLPSMSPTEVLLQTRHDLGRQGPQMEHQQGNMAYGVQGSYKSDRAEADKTLVVSTWNVNGINKPKLRLIAGIFKQDNTDVLICVDTRHTALTSMSFKRFIKGTLGPGVQVYCSTDPNRSHGDPGGIIIIVGPAWGPSYVPDESRSEQSGHGVLARIHLRTVSGFLAIYGTYWPYVPNGVSHVTEGSRRLWSRLSEFCRSHNPLELDPIQYLQHIMLQWIAKDWERGCQGAIAGGDFNSRWRSDDTGGQRSLASWANDHYLINGPRLITDKANITEIFYTYGKSGWSNFSWIDHLLHVGDPATIDILGAFNDTGMLPDAVSDHKPLIGVYKTPPPRAVAVPMMPKPRARPELPRGDQRQIATYKARISDVLQQIPHVVDSASQAEESLELATKFLVQLTREINEEFGGGTKKHKDGFSPEYVIRKLHLDTILTIRRHIYRQHGAKPWIGHTFIRRCINTAYEGLRQRSACLGLSQARVDSILDSVPNATLEYWMSLDLAPSLCQLDNALKALRGKLHGRQRTDMRLAQKGYTAYIEQMREKGRLKGIIKALLGANAGRKHQDGLNLEYVVLSSGDVIGDPRALHEAHTSHYESHYAMSKDQNNALHNTQDWSEFVENKDTFLEVFRDSNIPQWCLDIIHRALQPKPQAQKVHDELMISLSKPPTLQDFKHCIRGMKTNSAPGPSGLSYNMLKSLPNCMLEYVYDKMLYFWMKPAPASWSWRWLHYIPKTYTDNMGFDKFRPLMLCEALRKLWSTQVTSRISAAFTKHRVLEPVHHAFLPGRSTDTATMIHMNHAEDTEEKLLTSHQSSFDLSKAFDTTSRPLLEWSWRRAGVPQEAAHYLATIDAQGTTIVKSSWASYLWDLLPYTSVQTSAPYPVASISASSDSALVKSFCPQRGTGQGDPPSPLNWNAVYDIVATALRIQEEGQEQAHNTWVGAEDNEMTPQPNLFYADDLKFVSLLARLLQAKADLLSACCIVLGLQLSESKLRRLVQHFAPGRDNTLVEQMIVYTAGWIPHSVKVQTTGSSDFLGGRYSVDNSSDDAFIWLKEKALLHTSCVRYRQGFSGASKIAVVASSTMPSLVYKAANAFLSHTDLQEVDKIIDTTMVTATNNMFSYPRKLLHMSRKDGGLGIACFSMTADTRKLQKIFGCLRSRQAHGHAARGMLSRLARKHGHHASSHQHIVVLPSVAPVHRGKLFCDGPQQMLQGSGLYFCRSGWTASINHAGGILAHILPMDSELRQYCLSLGIWNICDITNMTDGVWTWSLHGPLRQLQSILPTEVPQGPSPLLAGQFWKIPYAVPPHISAGDIVRVDGKNGDQVVCVRLRPSPSRKSYSLAPKYIVVSNTLLFKMPTAIRCFMKSTADNNFVSEITHVLPSPQWLTGLASDTPPWVQWVSLSLDEWVPKGYVARPYTDGAHKWMASVPGYFRKENATRIATAAIIIKDDTTAWKTKPIFAIHITHGEEVDAESAFTMEYLALAGALQMTSFNVEVLHATGTDAKSVLGSIFSRRQRLQRVTHDHHFLLQCIDHYLSKGAPMPYHVKGHAERRKPERDSHGCYGRTWTKDDWGNWIADRVAADDNVLLCKHGLHIRHISVKAKDMYEHLRYIGQWYIGTQDAVPALPKGVNAIMQSTLRTNYLRERDGYRVARNEDPVWEHDSSMSHAADIYELVKAPPSLAATIVRIIYNKGYHGGNRAKDSKLSDVEREAARACKLCGKADSQDHWLHYCTFSPLKKMRDSILTDLQRQVTSLRDKGSLSKQLGYAFVSTFMSTDEPARIWTANWTIQQMEQFGSMLSSTLLDNLELKHMAKILKPLEKTLAKGALNLWQCKVVNERNMSAKQMRTTRKAVTPRRSPSRTKYVRSSTGIESSMIQHVAPTQTQRLQAIAPLFSRDRHILTGSIVFPALTKQQMHILSTACLSKRLSKCIVSVDGRHHLTGAMFQRLCGNELDQLYDLGRLHRTILTAFYQLLRVPSKTELLDEDTTQLLLDERFDKVYRKLLGRKPMTNIFHRETLFIIFTDREHWDEPVWTLAAIHFPSLTISVHCLNGLSETKVDHYISSITKWLQRATDGKYGDRPIEWTTKHDTVDVLPSQCGLWICLLGLLYLNNISPSILTVDTIVNSRKFIATCLLEKHVPSIRDMVVMTTQTTDCFVTDISSTSIRLPGVYYPTSNELEGYLPEYNMLHTGYSFPTFTPQGMCSHECVLRPPELSSHQILLIRKACCEQIKSDRISHGGPPGIADDGETVYDHYIEGNDIRDLIRPAQLHDTVVNTLLHNHFQDDTNIVYISTVIMNAFRTKPQSLEDNVIIANAFNKILQDFLSRTWTIFAFAEGQHFVSVVILRRTQRSKARVAFLDSLKNKAEPYVDIVRELVLWVEQRHPSRTRCPTDMIEWKTIIYPTEPMQPQLPHRVPGFEEDLGSQIDCGIYMVLMNILYTMDLPLSLLTPYLVHKLRIYFAYFLVSQMKVIPVADWITKESESAANVEGENSDVNDVFSCVEPDVLFQEEDKGRRLVLPRRAKPSTWKEEVKPLPHGRVIHHIPTDDEAQLHTYAAPSTFSDPGNGIDAGLGLFASRMHGHPSPLDNSDLVGYYLSSKKLTAEEVHDYMYNPEPKTNTGFMIEFQGLYADGWNHEAGTYTGMAPITNDPLDPTLYNCGYVKERIKRGRKTVEVIAQRVLPDKCVTIHTEFGIEYGHTAFCRASLPIRLLFKAVRHYWKRILEDKSQIWSRLPQARYLFNTPYHSLAPLSLDAIIDRSIHHSEHCKPYKCSCNIDMLTVNISTNISLTDHCVLPQNPCPDATNTYYNNNLRVLPEPSMPEAGLGLQIIGGASKGTIIGIYENAPGGKRVTASRVRDNSNKSKYAVHFQNLFRDAYDTSTNRPHGKIPYANDALDENADNLEFYIHPLRPNKLLLRTTKDIDPGSFGYLPYGAQYWCDDSHSLATQMKAIIRYKVNIHTSNVSTDGDWKSLANFPQLCLMYPSCASDPILTSTSERQLCFPLESASWDWLNSACSTALHINHLCGGSFDSNVPYVINTGDLRRLRADQITDTVVYDYIRLLCRTTHGRYIVLDPLLSGPLLGIGDSITIARVHHHLRHIPLFTCAKLLVIVFKDNHISLLVADYATEGVLHADSLGSFHNGALLKTKLVEALQAHWRWRAENDLVPLHPLPQRWSYTPLQVTQQADGVSCGIHTAMNATCLVHNINPTMFTAAHMPRARIHIANCIQSFSCVPPEVRLPQPKDLEDNEFSIEMYQRFRQEIRANPTLLPTALTHMPTHRSTGEIIDLTSGACRSTPDITMLNQRCKINEGRGKRERSTSPPPSPHDIGHVLRREFKVVRKSADRVGQKRKGSLQVRSSNSRQKTLDSFVVSLPRNPRNADDVELSELDRVVVSDMSANEVNIEDTLLCHDPVPSPLIAIVPSPSTTTSTDQERSEPLSYSLEYDKGIVIK